MENTVICSTGHITPVPAASSTRPTSTHTKFGPNHASREPTVNTAIEQITIWRVEKRRVRNAVSGTMTPMTSWNTEVSHCPVVTEMWNSETIIGSAELSCSCVKLPTKVIKVNIAMEMNAARLSLPSTYDSSRLSTRCSSPRRFLIPRAPFIPLTCTLHSR